MAVQPEAAQADAPASAFDQRRANEKVTVDTDPSFYLKFLDVYLGEPSVDEESYTERTWSSDKFKPQECRLRDNNYSAQARRAPPPPTYPFGRPFVARLTTTMLSSAEHGPPRASSFLLALLTPAKRLLSAAFSEY